MRKSFLSDTSKTLNIVNRKVTKIVIYFIEWERLLFYREGKSKIYIYKCVKFGVFGNSDRLIFLRRASVK